MKDSEKETLFRKIQKKFPVMNILDYTYEKPKSGVYVEIREIDDYIVHLEIGVSNVYIWSIQDK